MSTKKPRNLNDLNHSDWDVIIIGGGIAGAGVLLDLTTRGLKALLIEKNDFASGTSSRSTKLIHGGLRYLKQADFKIVKESARERSVLHELASHLVKPEKMLLPIMKDSQLSRFEAWIGLSLYDFLARVKKDEAKKMLNKDEVLEIEPLINHDSVLGGGIYSEYRTDDARLVIEVIKTAQDLGGHALNYLSVDEFIFDDSEKIIGVKTTDKLTDQKIEFRANHFVNATGAWGTSLRELAGEIIEDDFCYTKGSHLVIEKRRLPVKQSIYFQGQDSRMIFVVPRLDRVYIGTTDIFYDGDKLSPQIDQEEVYYLLRAINYLFPSNHIEKTDIISTWSGIRTLIKEKGKSESEISRRDEVFQAESGLISVVGGKLTGYRKMSEKIGDIISNTPSQTLNTRFSCSFKDLRDLNECQFVLKNELNQLWSDYLIFTYGKRSLEILGHFKQTQNLVIAELNFCLKYDSIYKALDFYERRTSRLLFYPDTVRESLEDVLNVMGEHLEWNEKDIEDNRLEVEKELTRRSDFS